MTDKPTLTVTVLEPYVLPPAFIDRLRRYHFAIENDLPTGENCSVAPFSAADEVKYLLRFG